MASSDSPAVEGTAPDQPTSRTEADDEVDAGLDRHGEAGSEASGERVGLKDFLACQSEGGFALMAVAAEAPMVTACLVDAWGPERVLEDVEVRTAATADGSDPARLVTVIQLRDAPWTVVFKALANVSVHHVLALSDRAADLSRTLDVEALVFCAETLDGDAGYELWQDGERVERALWTVRDVIHRFESKLRDEPPGEPDLDLPDGLFVDRGIHIPACRPFSRENEAWLEVARPDADDVERVDLIDLAGRFAVPEEHLQKALEEAKAGDVDAEREHDSLFRSVLELMGRVFH